MKILKLTLIALLAVCFVSPAMGYQQSKKKAPKKLARTEENIQSGTNADQPKVIKWEGKVKRIYGEYKVNNKRDIKVEKLERLLIKKKTKKVPQEQKQTVKNTQETEQPADYCEKNCTPKFGPDLYEAEIQLQKIRDTQDPNASFEKYPWLLYEHSDNCQYSKKQPIPGANKVQTPEEK